MANNFEIQYLLTNIQEPFKGGEIPLDPSFITYFWFCENIENMYITGSLEIEDTGGFFERLPLTGEEILKVTITQDLEKDESDNTGDSKNFQKIIEFELYKTPIKDINKNRLMVYEFRLAEKGFFEFFRKQYSKSYSEKFITDIIKDICNNQLGIDEANYDIEETADKIDYIIPYWKPSITIQDLRYRSRRKKTPSEGSYLFFSTIGDIDRKTPLKRLVSFATLLEQEVNDTIFEKFYFKKQDINSSFINNIKELRNINYNNRSIINEGIGGKKNYYIDLINDKVVKETTKIYDDFISNSPILGTKSYLSLYLNDVDSDVKFSGLDNENDIKRSQDTRFRMSLENYNKREIVIEGLLDRYSGRKIYLEEMSNSAGEVENEKDSGEWLIKGVTNYFTINNFEQRITIIKDAWSVSDVDGHITI